MRTANVAQARLIVNGADLADRIDPRLLSFTLTESREDSADRLDLVLHNTDGRLAPLPRGAELQLALGWRRGSDIVPGLIDKGGFTVDEVERSGPPDIVTIRARSADLTGPFRKRRDRVWRDTQLGAVLADIATGSGFSHMIHPALDGLAVALLEQAGKSDMAFLQDLGRRFDATATVKDRTIIFAPIGAGQSASGRDMARRTFTRRDGWTWRFTTASRDEFDGAEAQWHDANAARRRTATAGGSKNPRRLKKVYATEEEARAAAQADHQRRTRATRSFEYELALGDPAIGPETPVTLQGWDSEIDGIDWIVKEATHTFGADGLKTRLVMESRG